MTSNIGANILNKKENTIGFKNNISEDKENFERNKIIDKQTKDEVLKEVEKVFKKEFLNRIDDIIIFNTLSNEVILKIINKYLKELEERCKKVGYDVFINEKIADIIFKNLPEKESGARDIKRKIKELIEEKIVEVILEKNIQKGNKILIENQNGIVEIKV